MHIKTPSDSEIRYNPVDGCFEARVTIRDASRLYIYPAQITAPIMAEPREIRTSLVETARQLHAAPERGTHLHQLASAMTHLAA